MICANCVKPVAEVDYCRCGTAQPSGKGTGPTLQDLAGAAVALLEGLRLAQGEKRVIERSVLWKQHNRRAKDLWKMAMKVLHGDTKIAAHEPDEPDTPSLFGDS